MTIEPLELGWHELCFGTAHPEVVMLNFSPHALLRSAQRRVAPEHIDVVLAWGRPLRQPCGRVAWHLGDREASDARAAGVHVPARAIDVAVVLADDGTVVTVVRSDDRHRLSTRGLRTRRLAGGAR